MERRTGKCQGWLIGHASPLTLATTSSILLSSWLAGIVTLMLLAKNRVYFAKVARYVNEIRHLYLQKHPAQIANKANMFNDVRFPPIWDKGSTQTFQIYLVAIFDSFLFAVGVIALVACLNAVNGKTPSLNGFWFICGLVAFVASLLIELRWIFAYWSQKESESISQT